MAEMEELLERVEKATEGDQGPLLRETRTALVPYTPDDGPWISRFVHLIDAGGYESAALALVERVLPGCEFMFNSEEGRTLFHATIYIEPDRQWAYSKGSPALALLAALLRALIACAQAAG
jgi:hypothetical protein